MTEPRANGRARSEANRAALRALFESAAVYADRFPPHVRDALDVADELTPVVTAALEQRHTVVISGNAGDGKSHLGQRALDNLPNRTCIDVTKDTGAFTTPKDAVVFVRDVSALSNDQDLAAVRAAQDAGAALLLTTNEGPL